MKIERYIKNLNIKRYLKTVIWLVIIYACFFRYHHVIYAYDSSPIYEADTVKIYKTGDLISTITDTDVLIDRNDSNIVWMVKPWDIKIWTHPGEPIYSVTFLKEEKEIDTVEVVRLSDKNVDDNWYTLKGESIVLKSGYRYFGIIHSEIV